MITNFNPFESGILTDHIKRTYSLAFPMNQTTVILIRRPSLDDGNFGSESNQKTEIRYSFKLNINPVKAKPYVTNKEGIVKTYSHEVFSNPEVYPIKGQDKNGQDINVKLETILSTDLIVFQDKTYSLSESFEDVSLNDQDTLCQHFFMKMIV